MSRPRTTLGTCGAIVLTPQVSTAAPMENGRLRLRWIAAGEGVKPGRWQARTYFRDRDGVLRDVVRYASSKAKAETLLKAALVDRRAPTHGRTMCAGLRFDKAAALWLADVEREDSGLSTQSRRLYRGIVARWITGSTIAGLSLSEANAVPVLRSYLQHVADSSGPGTAKSARTVVSLVLGMAVSDGALPYNAMRDVRTAKPSKAKAAAAKDIRRAFTRAERDALLAYVDTHERSVVLDVADLVWFMAGTGVRLSEALSLPWAAVDTDKGTAAIGGTKTEGSRRVLHLPPWLVERLAQRAAVWGSEGLVFASPWLEARRGSRNPHEPRDHSNVSHALRRLFDEAGHPWASSHTFRRTVASLIDEAGLPVALAADVLGHADPAMTARVYLGRRSGTAAAAAVL